MVASHNPDLLVMPHEKLRQRAESVPVGQKIHPEFIKKMKDTMVLFNAQGLAAPQLGMSKRIIMIRRLDDSFLLMVNPRFVEWGGDWVKLPEACLSLPDKPAQPVLRESWVDVEYIGEDGNLYLTRFEGVESRAVQHEIDHLNGILLTDLW